MGTEIRGDGGSVGEGGAGAGEGGSGGWGSGGCDYNQRYTVTIRNFFCSIAVGSGVTP